MPSRVPIKDEFPNDKCSWNTASALNIKDKAQALLDRVTAGEASQPYNTTILGDLSSMTRAIPRDIQEAAGISAMCIYAASLQAQPSHAHILRFARNVKWLASAVIEWHQDADRRETEKAQDQVEDLVVRGSWDQALKAQNRCADLMRKRRDMHGWRWETLYAARICLALLKIEEAEEASQRLATHGQMSGEWATERWSSEQALLICSEAAHARSVGLYHGCPVQIVNVPGQPTLDGSVGTIYGKTRPLANRMRTLLFAPPEDDAMYDVCIGEGRVSVHRSQLYELSVVVQLTNLAHLTNGIRVEGRTLGGVGCTGLYLSLEDLTAAKVRRDAARILKWPPAAIKCALPSGALVEDGPVGDAALRECVSQPATHSQACALEITTSDPG